MTAVNFSPPAQLAWLRSLHQPELALNWTLAEWERVVRLARRLRLLARLAEALTAKELIESVPAQPRRHLIAERRLSRWRTGAIVWAIERVATMLGETGFPSVLLKGAAYIAQDLPIAPGRLPSDLDVLVPRLHLADALARLEATGWKSIELDEHDRRYYFEWSHEVPPMTHPLHSVELDLHHNILPPVARTTTDANLLIARLQPSKWPSWHVLDPIDQVLHCAAHLFLDPDARDRMRDLVDLDGMLRHFGARPGFWDALPGRAQSLGLVKPLALACHLSAGWLGTEIPAEALAAIAANPPWGWGRNLQLALFARILMPVEPDEDHRLSQDLAAFAVLAHHHRQRMPLRMLVPHMWHKMRIAARTVDEEVPDAGVR